MKTLEPPVISLITATSCAGEGSAAVRTENNRVAARTAFFGIGRFFIMFRICRFVFASRPRPYAYFTKIDGLLDDFCGPG
jgi:hypothetical protein